MVQTAPYGINIFSIFKLVVINLYSDSFVDENKCDGYRKILSTTGFLHCMMFRMRERLGQVRDGYS